MNVLIAVIYCCAHYPKMRLVIVVSTATYGSVAI